MPPYSIKFVSFLTHEVESQVVEFFFFFFFTMLINPYAWLFWRTVLFLICVGWLSGSQSILGRAFSWASKARTFHTGASDMQPTVNSRLLLKSLSLGSRFFWNLMDFYFYFYFLLFVCFGLHNYITWQATVLVVSVQIVSIVLLCINFMHLCLFSFRDCVYGLGLIT